MADAVIGKLVDVACEWAKPQVKKLFNYLCCFTANINNLKDEARKLDDAAAEIRGRVGRAEDNAEEILPAVKTLLENSNKIKEEAKAILDKEEGVRSGCLKFGARFSLSRKATKKAAETASFLRDECSKYSGNETAVSQPRPPPAREAVPLRNAYEFESRKQTEEDIMAVLRGGDVSMIGICGMPGLGKTTMAMRIMNKVREEGVFKEVPFAVVSQNVDKRKIQREISGSLGLTLKENDSDAVIEDKMRARLSDKNKTLLVLDDVWEPIELEEFGIPCDSKGCTILITSRNKGTLSTMDVKDFGVKILSEEEARFLFTEKAGACMDHADLKSIGEDIVKECKGLPIALVTLGAALKGEKGPSVWRNALTRMRQTNPDDLIAKFYAPLKLSYDLLSSKEDKSLFLLFSLFPEDAHIPIEFLACFGIGLDIYEGITNLEELRDRVSAGVKKLKDRSLLLDSEEGDDCVRMHDVVRDVCIFIAKEEGHVEGNNCSWISSFEQLGEGTKLPNLNLLFLSCLHWEKAPKLDNTIFEWISDLRVLCIQNYSSFTSLPSTHSLQNIKSLVLFSCGGLETLSAIGGFINLEILICFNCSLIKELPLEIKRLNGLKLLDISECENLQTISQGIISSLCGLEELKMIGSFNKWELKDREERENAGLRELEKLINLRCLEIEIEDPALAAEKIQLSSKIKRFHIEIGTKGEFFDHQYKKIMFLELEREEPCSVNSISMQFLRDTEYLNLAGSGANSMDLEKCQNIRWLELAACETITSMVDDATALEASLEHLILYDLPKLEGICEGAISSNSFHNLKELKLHQLPALKQFWKSSSVPPLLTNLSSINIEGCDILCNLGQLSMVGKDCLPQLQELVIKKCEKMEQVFMWNKNRNDSESPNDHCIGKVFQNLKKIELSDLPNLATFCQGMGGFEFPLLTELSIEECPKLKGMGYSVDIDDDSSHLLCQPKKVSFCNIKELSLQQQWNPFRGHEIPLSLLNGLEVLKLSSLCGSWGLFSASVAGNLVNLRVLKITKCEEMLKVIEDNKEDETEKVVSGEDEKEKVVSFDNDSESQSYCCITKLFSKQKKVIKRDEMLKVIEGNKEVIEENVVSGTAQMPLILFPNLEELSLEDLPKLVTFCEWKCDVKFPLLKKVIMNRCRNMKNLSLGFLQAPKLEHFDSDFEHNIESEVSFDSLKILEISEIEKPLSGHKFFNGLIEIKVFKCSMSCLFTSSMARHLDSLQVLTIEECYKMVKVIEDEENEEKVGNGGGERTLLFPKLKTLELDGLPKLESFCEWKCDIELPSLRDVKIGSCPVLRNFSMGSIAVAPILNSVLQQLEYIITVTVSDSKLEVLCIKREWNPFSGHITPLSLFNGLDYIVLRRLHGSTSLLSSSVARNLVNLRVLIINQCYEMLKVIEDKKEEKEKVVSGAVGMPRILFPVLEKLELEDLPKLVTFCDWKCDVKLPSLKEATILGCPAMENFNLGSVAAPKLDCFKTDFKHNLEIGVKVSFDSLKKLILSEIEKPLHGHNIFNGLKEIEVCYSSMTYLFTSSMARCLDSLQVLIIKQCNKIVKVIEDEENEEKVGSGGERSTLLFPKLRKLELECLPKLESFCEWKCDIEFPSLRDVDILDCPVLRIFTMGSIAAAPNLERFEFYQEYISKEIYDLNIVVQEYMTLTEEREMMEGGEEQIN